MKCCALVVEDDPSVQQLLKVVLREHCSKVDVADDGDVAISLLRDGTYDLLILDLMLPRKNGFMVAEAAREIAPRTRIIVLSGVARYFEHRFPPGTVVLQKPFDIGKLGEAVRVNAVSVTP